MCVRYVYGFEDGGESEMGQEAAKEITYLE